MNIEKEILNAHIRWVRDEDNLQKYHALALTTDGRQVPAELVYDGAGNYTLSVGGTEVDFLHKLPERWELPH
jgi:hypothetical protein